MAPTIPTESQGSNGSVEASRSYSPNQEKSSIGKITKTPTKSRATKNALNPEFLKKVQELLEEDIGTNCQESELYNLLRYRSNTLTANFEQLPANLVYRRR